MRRKHADRVQMPKALVRELEGHEDMIAFLSNFRTRDHMHGARRWKHERTKKYYPEGALFWFECDVYGRQNGPAYYIKHVPDPSADRDEAFRNLLQERERIPDVKELLLREKLFMVMPEAVRMVWHDFIPPKPQKNPCKNRKKQDKTTKEDTNVSSQ